MTETNEGLIVGEGSVEITDGLNLVGEGRFIPVRQFNWKPQEDITAYELALCLPAIFGGWNACFYIDGLPDNARRHFEEV